MPRSSSDDVRKLVPEGASHAGTGLSTLGRVAAATGDAPDYGAFNYSLAVGGPDIRSVLVQTQPTLGPKSGKRFVVSLVGVKLPPSGAVIDIVPKPDSYTCRATLKGRAMSGTGTGGCTYLVPKKSRGKQLKVVATVVYEGATKAFSFPFTVS